MMLENRQDVNLLSLDAYSEALRIADRALCLTLEVQRDIFLEKANRIDDSSILTGTHQQNAASKPYRRYLGPNDLLHAK